MELGAGYVVPRCFQGFQRGGGACVVGHWSVWLCVVTRRGGAYCGVTGGCDPGVGGGDGGAIPDSLGSGRPQGDPAFATGSLGATSIYEVGVLANPVALSHL